ncbi:hypothetical protein AAC387_Pa11g1821 [Persea americana]
MHFGCLVVWKCILGERIADLDTISKVLGGLERRYKPHMFAVKGTDPHETQKHFVSTQFLLFAKRYPIRNSTDRVDSTDDEKMTIKYSVIDGDLIGGFYTKFQPTLQIIPKENGCLAKWAVDYEKANEEVADPHVVVEYIIEVLHALDEHVLRNN